jgi:hypothetical protein
MTRRMTRFTALTLLALCAAPSLALAAPCDADLRKIDKALASADLPPDQKAQAKDMRNQAEKLCGAGNQEEAADVLAEIKSMLAVE